MKPNAREIVEAGHEALRRAGAPICYLHEDGQSPAFALVVTREWWNRVLACVPEGNEEIQDLVMNHGHIEGDEDDG